MKLNAPIAISLSLNFALVIAAVGLFKKSGPPGPGASAAALSETTTALTTSSRPAADLAPAPSTCVTNPFAWGRVEAEDWEQLATNLRAIGCPDKTVRDIVLARGRRALEQVSLAAEPKLTFWTAGIRRRRAQAAAARQAELAQEEIVARVERVVGPDVFLSDPKMMNRLEDQAVMRFLFGPLPDETFYQVAAKLAGFDARRAALEGRTLGMWLAEDETELAQLRGRYRRELATLLSPSQLEEMTARMAMIPRLDQLNFEATDLNAGEVRQLGMIRARFVDPLEASKFSNGEKSLTDEQDQERKQAERQFLGAARFAQLERAADGEFRALFSLSQEHALPRDAAATVFELRQLSAQEMQRLQRDNSLTDADRKERLTQMQAEVQQTVLQVLGAEVSGQYLGRGGAWLTNRDQWQ